MYGQARKRKPADHDTTRQFEDYKTSIFDFAMGDSYLQEVLPKAGLVYSEKGNLSEVLCKPKILPIKSVSLQKIEEMERKAKELGQDQDAEQNTLDAIGRNHTDDSENLIRDYGAPEGSKTHETNIMKFD